MISLKNDALLLISLILFLGCIISCSSNTPEPEKIKPSANPPAETGDEKQATDDTPESLNQPREAGQQYVEPPREVRMENDYLQLHSLYIMQSLMFYRDAYGKFPDDASVLLDGWMVMWPNNIYTHEPIKFLKEPPVVSDPSDIGNIYYEKIDDDFAKFYHVLVDLENSTVDNFKYYSSDHEILYEEQYAYLEPDNPRFEELRKIKDKPQEKIKHYYKYMTYRLLNGYFDKAMQLHGTFDMSFTELAKTMDFKMSPVGLTYLKEAVKDGSFSFDIGMVGEQDLNYFKFEGLEMEVDGCWKLLKDLGTSGTVEKRAECPENWPNAKSIFNSDNLDSFAIDLDLIVSKDEIVED